jgi:hypothetical protein
MHGKRAHLHNAPDSTLTCKGEYALGGFHVHLLKDLVTPPVTRSRGNVYHDLGGFLPTGCERRARAILIGQIGAHDYSAGRLEPEKRRRRLGTPILTDHAMPSREQSLREMAADKPGGPGYENG